ncbi:MAG: FHIPEP family type III secretion protein, partial [Myxococcales bacterium]|nr:FHIPEP family type III secretion protein [Myxococcales bacterium]
ASAADETLPDAAPTGLVPLVAPISIAVGDALAAALDPARAAARGAKGAPPGEPRPSLDDAIGALRDRVFLGLGLSLPNARVHLDRGRSPWRYTIAIQEVPAEHGEVATGATTEEATADVIAACERAVRARAGDLLGLQETQNMLDRLERAYPALVRHVIPKPVGLALLTDVLRRLVEEGVSVRPLREILEALATYAPNERDPVTLTELVRGSLRRHISHLHAPDGTLRAHMLDPAIEDVVREAIQHTATGSYLALAPDLAEEVLAHARRVATGTGGRFVLLAQPDVRRFVRRLLEVEVPGAVVLSYPELDPAVRVETLGRLSL